METSIAHTLEVEEKEDQIMDEVEDETTKKFTSPEAGAERLSKLDPEILGTLNILNEENI